MNFDKKKIELQLRYTCYNFVNLYILKYICYALCNRYILLLPIRSINTYNVAEWLVSNVFLINNSLYFRNKLFNIFFHFFPSIRFTIWWYNNNVIIDCSNACQDNNRSPFCIITGNIRIHLFRLLRLRGGGWERANRTFGFSDETTAL